MDPQMPLNWVKRYCPCFGALATLDWNKSDERLLQAVEHSDPDKVAALLVKKGLCGSKLDPEGRSAFHVSASKGRTDCLEVFLSHGVDVTSTDGNGLSALHLAAKNGHTACVRRLLQEGVPVDLTDSSGRTALHYAAIHGCVPCVETLGDFKACIDVQDADGSTPLLLATRTGHTMLCTTLLGRGADANLPDTQGRSALMLAYETGNMEMTEALLRAGANPQCAHGNQCGTRLLQSTTMITDTKEETYRPWLRGGQLPHMLEGLKQQHTAPTALEELCVLQKQLQQVEVERARLHAAIHELQATQRAEREALHLTGAENLLSPRSRDSEPEFLSAREDCASPGDGDSLCTPPSRVDTHSWWALQGHVDSGFPKTQTAEMLETDREDMRSSNSLLVPIDLYDSLKKEAEKEESSSCEIHSSTTAPDMARELLRTETKEMRQGEAAEDREDVENTKELRKRLRLLEDELNDLRGRLQKVQGAERKDEHTLVITAQEQEQGLSESGRVAREGAEDSVQPQRDEVTASVTNQDEKEQGHVAQLEKTDNMYTEQGKKGEKLDKEEEKPEVEQGKEEEEPEVKQGKEEEEPEVEQGKEEEEPEVEQGKEEEEPEEELHLQQSRKEEEPEVGQGKKEEGPDTQFEGKEKCEEIEFVYNEVERQYITDREMGWKGNAVMSGQQGEMQDAVIHAELEVLKLTLGLQLEQVAWERAVAASQLNGILLRSSPVTGAYSKEQTEHVEEESFPSWTSDCSTQTSGGWTTMNEESGLGQLEASGCLCRQCDGFDVAAASQDQEMLATLSVQLAKAAHELEVERSLRREADQKVCRLQSDLQSIQQTVASIRHDKLQNSLDANPSSAEALRNDQQNTVSREDHEARCLALRAQISSLASRLGDLSRKHHNTCCQVLRVQREALFSKAAWQAAEAQLSTARQHLAHLKAQSGHLGPGGAKRECNRLPEFSQEGLFENLTLPLVIPSCPNQQVVTKGRVAMLTRQLQDWEEKHRAVVSVYRAHLLAAVQGRMDEEVQALLLQILRMTQTEQGH